MDVTALVSILITVLDLLFKLTLHSGLLTIGSAVATGTDNVDRHRIVLLSGSEAQILSCSSSLDASVAFYHKPWKSNEDADEIYDRYAMLNGYVSKYEVSRSSPRNYTLRTQDIQDRHAGEYSCFENDGIGRLLSTADLTVINSKPICNASCSSLCCEVHYFGANADLVIHWSRANSSSAETIILHGGRTETLEHMVVAEIEVDLAPCSDDSTNSPYFTIDIGYKCLNRGRVCPLLQKRLEVPCLAATHMEAGTTLQLELTSLTNNYPYTTEIIVIIVCSAILISTTTIIVCVVVCRLRYHHKRNKRKPNITKQESTPDSNINESLIP